MQATNNTETLSVHSTKEKQRHYFGFVVIDKFYIGADTIDYVVDAEQGRKLAELIGLAAGHSGEFDLKFVRKPRKSGKYTLTVSRKKRRLAPAS
jgi:hypothetical protein